MRQKREAIVYILLLLLSIGIVLAIHSLTTPFNVSPSTITAINTNITVNFTINNGGPQQINRINVTSPSANIVFQNVSINNTAFACQVNSTFANCSVAAGSANLSSGESVVISINLSASNDGNYTFNFTSVDNSSDINYSDSYFLNVDATPTLTLAADGTTATVNTTSPSNYSLFVNISTITGNASGVNVTIFLPSGITNASPCANFSRHNNTANKCILSIGSVANNNLGRTNLNISVGVNSFPRYGTNTLDFTANCTDNSACTQGSSQIVVTVHPYHKNPRPDAAATSGASRIFFTNWVQSEPEYKVMVPIYTYNATTGPVPANGTFGDILFFSGGSIFEFPTQMKLWSYNLTFKLIFDSAGNATWVIRTPVNTSTSGNQGFLPLFLQTSSFTDFVANKSYNQTSAFPNANQFTVYLNGTARNNTGLSSQGLDISFVGTGDQSASLMVVTVTNYSLVNDTNITVMLTLANLSACQTGSCARSPIFVSAQELQGWSINSPPKFGETVQLRYFINVTNSLANYTLSGLKLSIMQPMNVTMNSSGTISQFNMTTNISTTIWNGSQYVGDNGTRTDSSFSFLDAHGPTNGSNVTVFISTFDITLNDSYATMKSWEPGVTPYAQVNFTASLSFPVLNETGSTPGTAGSSNQYNATINSPQRAPLNLTSKVPGLTSSSTDLNVTIDGVQVVSSNLTIGSLTINDVAAGSHVISVSYSVPAASSSSSSSSSGGSSSGSGSASASVGGLSSSSQTTSYIWDNLVAGQTGIWNIKTPSVDFASIQFDAAKALSGPQIQVATITSLPKGTEGLDGTVSQYLQVNLFKFTDADLKNVKINFKVLESWLKEKGFKQSDILLFRYDSKAKKWNELPTKYTKSDAKHAFYEATSPGFSLFAIGTKQQPAATAVSETEQGAQSSSAVKPAEASSSTAKETAKSNVNNYFIALALLILALAVLVFKKRQR